MSLLNRFIVGLPGLIVVVALALFALHRNGAIETDVLIDSSPQAVWQVLTATADYPAWNPEISRLEGQLREGNVIEFAEGTGPDAMVFHPRILVVRPERELRWKGYVWLPGLFDGEHWFVLEPVGNRTRFIQGETFTGVLVGRLTLSVLKATVDSMREMNEALKQRTEQTSAASPDQSKEVDRQKHAG
ncbi:SRPBCC domain-containing protein [Burkholderia sp. 9120]|uniref:SRPBCC domain-containing protein n=1 Tax=Burkholderia sp. 9120 TaxID=1500897 RepID=UPI00068F99BF|nr:SRPBCC domain-containing protein [Burkholderia sp. 9120]